MSDTGSSLAITTEKRPHRPGGYVGIFFQLFDWNRRFAKTKLFPKKQKLLPPVHAKQASKKFGADDKPPKLRLISGENSGGFPNVKKNGTQNLDSEQKDEMQTPGLVARLMGLDSMPSIQRDKLKKTSCSEIGSDRGGRFADDHGPFGKEDENLERVGTKHELMPRKLQKTGPHDRRAVTRFGTEALQFKNVLLRSTKCKHHPKLATPVKSPKSLSGRNTSRLIGAATRILEPGLQSRNRAKCALPYSNKMQHSRADEVMVEETTDLSQDPLESSTYYAHAALLSRGKSSCKNCGNFLNIVHSRPNLEEQPSVSVLSASNYVDHSCPRLERSRPRSPVSSLEPDKEGIFQRTRENLTAPAAQAMDSVRPRAEPISDMTPLQRVGQSRWQLESQHCNSQHDSPSSICDKLKIPRQNQVLMGRDRIPPRPKLSNMQGNRAALSTNGISESKDFIPLNRSSSGRSCSRLPAKMDNCRYESERKLSDKRDDPLSSVRKRRSVNLTRQDDISGFVSSTVDKQRNIDGNAMVEKVAGRVVQSTDANCIESRLARLRESNKTSGSVSGNKDNGVISFTFSSPMKQKGGIPAETKGRRDQNDSTCNSILRKNSVLDKISGQRCFQKSFPLTGDTLGALLEQKLKELTSQENDELAGGGAPKRTSATILQELISALTIDKPFHQNDVAVGRNEECNSSYGGHTSELHATFQKKTGARARYSNDHNNNLSPLSVLEASFSNESCFSSSLGDSSVHKLHIDFMDWSNNEPRHILPDADLLVSATSLNKGRPGIQMVADFVNHISEMLCSIDLVDSRLKGSKLACAKEVILNAELVFGTALQHNKDKTKAFSISHFLVDELETLASVLWTNSSCFSGFEDTEGNLLKGFLFDCVIEYLESRYGPCFKCGIKTFRNLPLCMNTEMLIREVVEEIRSWTGLVGFILDELIDREMSCCLGKWTDFEIEAFETGVAIDGDILQFLVDEIVLDLWQSKLGCSCSPC